VTARPDWLAAVAAKAAAARPITQAIVPDPVPGRVVHIDGDYLAYRCAGGKECPPNIARANVRDKVQALADMSGATNAVVHLTMPASTKGERYLIATVKPYQAQRTHSGRPANWEMLRGYLEDPSQEHAGFAIQKWHDREADDGMALASWQAQNPTHAVVIASPDKDMRMLAGLHVNFHDYTLTEVPRGSFEVIGADGLVYGHKWFWLQMLQGDVADNIPGLPRAEGKLCGEKTAAKYLMDAACNEYAFVLTSGLYRGHYGDNWHDAFVEQAALLWLRGSRAAHLHDFLRVVPRTPDIEAAAKRLIKRVKEQRAEIDAIHDKARAHETRTAAAG